MRHALTIDVEEFFQVHALSRVVSMDTWDAYPSSVEESAELILNLLEARGVKATFFCLGWIAERHPGLIRRIHRAGHEIASHGYAHTVIYDQEPAVFRADTSKAKSILEDITGEAVLGYRAPTYSITRRTLWALDILEELEYRYDSSIFPIRHDNYGIPSAPRFPHRLSPRRLVEFPISTVRFGSVNLPIAGGGYFRLLPYPVTRQGLRRIAGQGHPFIFYVHPWEFNPGIPRVASLSALSRFRTYVGLSRTQARFQRLLADFPFTTASNVLADLGLL
ncbi:MAG TPA: DUF3473 domain-containing protein [Deltaproteobacteria bacterium]|nr:DUF3473 domain-containing protein [Deltaproteobacteria bacterium]